MKTPTFDERRENALALIQHYQRSIYALERFLVNLEALAAQQIPAKEDAA